MMVMKTMMMMMGMKKVYTWVLWVKAWGSGQSDDDDNDDDDDYDDYYDDDGDDEYEESLHLGIVGKSLGQWAV